MPSDANTDSIQFLGCKAMFSFAVAILAVALWANSVWPFVMGNNRTDTTNAPLPVVDLGYTLQRATTFNVGSTFNLYAGHLTADLSHRRLGGTITFRIFGTDRPQPDVVALQHRCRSRPNRADGRDPEKMLSG